MQKNSTNSFLIYKHIRFVNVLSTHSYQDKTRSHYICNEINFYNFNLMYHETLGNDFHFDCR